MSEQEMMEKVIKGLEKLNENSGCIAINSNGCKTCPYDSVNRCCGQIIEDAIALLKAQEPVKPTIGRAVEHDGHDRWWYQCGKCEKPIDWQDNYCRHCGKPVKWE